MKQIETTIEVDAPTAEVWATLLGFHSYPAWNPFVRHIEGEPLLGQRLRVRIQPPGSRGMTFKPTVTAVDPGARLEWVGKLGLKGLFDGRHEFRLESLDGDRTRLVHRESFSGVLVGLLLDEDAIRLGFEEMNAALKSRVERRSTASDSAPDTEPTATAI